MEVSERERARQSEQESETCAADGRRTFRGSDAPKGRRVPRGDPPGSLWTPPPLAGRMRAGWEKTVRAP